MHDPASRNPSPLTGSTIRTSYCDPDTPSVQSSLTILAPSSQKTIPAVAHAPESG